MAKFNVEIMETLSRVITVEADSCEEAVYMAQNDYRHQRIVLDNEDFLTVDFFAEEV